MGLSIVDGTGTSNEAKVNSENKLECLCVEEVLFFHINHTHGEVYRMLFDKDPDGNDDCIVYIKNSDDKDLIINGAMIAVSGACEITLKLGVTGTPIGGSDVIPANMNAGSGNIATGTFQHGVDITGLSGGTNIEVVKIIAAAGSTEFKPDSNIILPKNSTFAAYVDTAGVIVEGYISFGYHDGND